MIFSRGGRFRPGLLFAGILLGSTALGQASTSVLTGNVIDASTKQPVADVVVTATSPSLQVACVKEDWVTTYLTGDPTQGIFFFTKPFPGLK